MSKRKPDKVIEYRFSLQDKEREMFNSAIGAYQMNRLVTPIITLMNDISGMVVFLSLAAAAGVTGVAFTFLLTNLEDMTMGGVLDSFLTQRQQAGIITGVTIADRGPLWGLFDILERAWGTNLPDFGGGYEPPEGGGGGGF